MWRQGKWPRRYNRVSRYELRERLEQYSRQPFGDVLHELLQCRPEREALAKWAERNPDKWAHAIEIFAKLNGYTEKTEHTENIFIHLSKMSDAHLRQALMELEAEERALAAPQPDKAQNLNTQLIEAKQEDAADVWAMAEQKKPV